MLNCIKKNMDTEKTFDMQRERLGINMKFLNKLTRT